MPRQASESQGSWTIKAHPTENRMPSSVMGCQHDMGPTLCSSRTRCCRRRAVVLGLAPGLGPSLDDRPHGEQSDDGNHLTSEDDSIDVHCWAPAQLAVADDERSDRASGHPKAATGPLALTSWILAPAGTGAALTGLVKKD